jgi:hypothetical protein
MTKLWVVNIRGLEVSAEKHFIKVKQSRYRPGVAQRVPES